MANNLFLMFLANIIFLGWSTHVIAHCSENNASPPDLYVCVGVIYSVWSVGYLEILCLQASFKLMSLFISLSSMLTVCIS